MRALISSHLFFEKKVLIIVLQYSVKTCTERERGGVLNSKHILIMIKNIARIQTQKSVSLCEIIRNMFKVSDPLVPNFLTLNIHHVSNTLIYINLKHLKVGKGF